MLSEEQEREQQELANEEKVMKRIDDDIARLRMRASMKLESECGAVKSNFADDQSLKTVLDGLANQLVRLRQHVEVIKHQPADQMQHQTFGGGQKLTKQQQERITSVVQTEKQKKSVPLDHAIVLVKHLVKMKTENYELETYIKEMKAKMEEAGVGVPSNPKQADSSE